MQTIWKFNLDVKDSQFVEIPVGFVPLTVQLQHGIPKLWAKVDPTQPTEQVLVVTHGTGHPADDTEGFTYIGSYQLQDGELVFHVWIA